jgi:hypothetical protein
VEEVQNVTCAEIIKYRYLKYHVLYKNKRNSIQWTSGCTGLLQSYSHELDTQSAQRILFKTVLIIYLEYAKDFYFFLFFLYACFLLVKNTRKISYNRNPVKYLNWNKTRTGNILHLFH